MAGLDSNTKLLLNLNGADAATSTTDESDGAHVITFAGTAQLDTAQQKFGTASCLVDGDSDYLSVPDSTDWDFFGSTDDWSMEMFVKLNAVYTNQYFFVQRADGNNRTYFRHDRSAGNSFFDVVLRVGGSNILQLNSDSGADLGISDTNWHHVALIKVATDYGIYLDGTQLGHTIDVSTGTIASPLYIGHDGNTNYLNGWMDGVRIQNSNYFGAAPVAGLTDTITVPTAEYAAAIPAVSITVLPYLSPRVVMVDSPATTITVQELVNLMRDWEDQVANLSYPLLVLAAGKEDLGGGLSVGITATLQNAVIGFVQRGVSDSTGTVTTIDASGTTLIDSSATFQTDGILPGDSIINFTDQSIATVLSVDSETQISHFKLEDGTDDDWDSADAYKVWNKIRCTITNGNVVSIDADGVSINAELPTAQTYLIKQSATSAALVSTVNADVADAVWDEALAGHTTAGSAGKSQKDTEDNAQIAAIK